MSTHFDVVVLGPGPGGHTAAVRATRLGKRVHHGPAHLRASAPAAVRSPQADIHARPTPGEPVREAIHGLAGHLINL
ncbi:MAG: hypothetical protein ACJ786_12445 [Catenulispora sp.]